MSSVEFLYPLFFLFALFSPLAGCRKTRPAVVPAENTRQPSAEPETMKPQMHLPRTLVTLKTPDGRRLSVDAQKARSEEEKAIGLMYRQHLPESEGMLFLYDHEEELGFYMANCLISLDMIFMDSSRKVIGIIKHARPMDPTVLSIGKPSQYVLEVNGGFTDRHRISEGTQVVWE